MYKEVRGIGHSNALPVQKGTSQRLWANATYKLIVARTVIVCAQQLYGMYACSFAFSSKTDFFYFIVEDWDQDFSVSCFGLSKYTGFGLPSS